MKYVVAGTAGIVSGVVVGILNIHLTGNGDLGICTGTMTCMIITHIWLVVVR